MNFPAMVFSIIVPSITGFLTVSWILGKDSRVGVVERIFLGYGTGLGLLTYEIFLLGSFGVTFSLLPITAGQAFISLVMLFLIYRRGATIKDALLSGGEFRLFRQGPRPVGLVLVIALVILAWILLKVSFVLHEGALRPLFSWDTWSNWSAGAKFFFFQKGFVLDRVNEHFFADGYRPFLGHPLHTTLLQLWVSLSLGEFHEIYAKLWSGFYFISVLAIFFYSIKEETNWFYALLMTFFLSTVPLLTFHGTGGYSDLPLGYYALASVLCFFRFMKNGERGMLIMSSVLLAMGVLTKNEGFFFLIAVATALCLFIALERTRPPVDLMWFIIPFLVIAGPWLIFKMSYGLGFGHTGADSSLVWLSDPKFSAAAERGLHWEIFPRVIRGVLLTPNFNLVFLFWAVFSFLGARVIIGSNIKYLYVIIVAVIGQFLFIYLTLEITAVTESSGMYRNMLTYAPIILFTSALVLYRLWPTPGSGAGEDRF